MKSFGMLRPQAVGILMTTNFSAPPSTTPRRWSSGAASPPMTPRSRMVARAAALRCSGRKQWVCQSISWRSLMSSKGRHHLRGEQLEAPQGRALRHARVRVAEEEILQATDLHELVHALDDVVRRSDQEVPRLQEVPVELRAGRELLPRIREHLAAPERIV